MTYVLVAIMIFFWIMLIFYSILTIAGAIDRSRQKGVEIEGYPPVDVLIPAHNEGVVIRSTLEAMASLEYPGHLNVYVLNDNSEDETGVIAEEFDHVYKSIHHINVPPGKPKGKSRVLNYGLSISDSPYFIIFDADNQPEPEAVKLLVSKAETTEDAAGAVGYVKTLNMNKNWLTRMIGLEFQVHQLMMQSGRWFLFRTGSLTGTNMLLRREVITELGGYDPYALAEDAELTMRISSAGLVLPIVAEARTWEQEPETLKTLVKQRTRWFQGNIYLLEKALFSKSSWQRKTVVHTLHHLSVYLFFVILLSISHVWFVIGIFGLSSDFTESPLIMFWYMSYVVYTIQHASAMVFDRTVSVYNSFISVIMYFTYSQVFLILLVRSLFYYIKNRRGKNQVEWDKTIRF
ncbi:N-acetylglucosaminyltransferase [Salimicrobium jeotgali]|uniref:Glycosyl transferase family protein n=1 Tax=Salimicrobium jeotgali TaxID=1230341 RepID=K2GCE2_9BACI|nr:glycosyltransferase [Salimicrobium jeotgali]AKG04449.1 N-acetylglucosaminyltransferase [Salimicrobium jeotgali]EKE32653.1 glycosyl transferase family protein [Salimicrobium jeotgali]MBM7695364.1 cellulose synthase/poly-beta-1,6-N-acetylglucosamine synthase-like glycosyltransferase [Salimicrobium jeotgali]